MEEETKKMLAEYHDIASKIKTLETMKEERGSHIVALMAREDAKTIKSDYGTFSMIPRTTYKFNDEAKEIITMVKNQVKVAETNQINLGNAVKTTTESLRFQAKKISLDN